MTQTPLVTQDELNEMLGAWNSKPTPSGFVLLQDEIVDQTRWSTIHNLVFKTSDGRYLAVDVPRGSTEYQDDDEVDPHEVYEVVPEEIVTVVYKRKTS